MPGGRPTKYKPEYCEQATNYCLLGATDEELEKYFGVCNGTINTWKKKYPEFMEALREGREIADRRVTEALYQKAINGDTTCMIFWLKNRQRVRWRDRFDHRNEVEANVTVTMERKIVGEG